MARNQKNFTLFHYVDDLGGDWNKRGEDGGAAAAVDGHATFGAFPVFPAMSRRYAPRRIVYTDLATFRKVYPVFYTAAAAAAVALGTDTIDVDVAGDGTAVAYTATRLLPERMPARAPSAPQLAD